MKYLLILFTTFCFSQQVITVGTNPKILTDKQFSGTFSWVQQFDNWEGGIALEYINLDPYFFTTGFIVNVPLVEMGHVVGLMGVEALYLQRGTIYPQSQKEFITGGLNAILRYYFSDFALNLRLNGKYRPDTIRLWDGQKASWGGFFELSYIFGR